MGFTRKHLSIEGLIQTVQHCIHRERLSECVKSDIGWKDCIMSGLAIFSLKFPSLLQFEKHKMEHSIKHNLKSLYGVNKVPSDTCLRERLDTLDPKHLRRAFKTIFAHLQRGKVLEEYKSLDGNYTISIDGTGQYSSETIGCENCCEKYHRNGKKTYYHHMLGAALVHPKKRVVIPFAPEPIVKGDGATKNDCERNASKRFLQDLRREHPHLKITIVEDALASNYPHLSLLDSLNMRYVIGVKEGDHDFLFDWIRQAEGKKYVQKDSNETAHTFQYFHDVPLNDEHYDYRVNVIDYYEETPKGKKQHFSWVTSFKITDENVYELMRIGRARWRIENETFNTLKNQGYNFEHNYGHGNKNLCSVMTMLMLLSFLIDQVQQRNCSVYQKIRQKAGGTLRGLFEYIRTFFSAFMWNSWTDLYQTILYPSGQPPPTLDINLM